MWPFAYDKLRSLAADEGREALLGRGPPANQPPEEALRAVGTSCCPHAGQTFTQGGALGCECGRQMQECRGPRGGPPRAGATRQPPAFSRSAPDLQSWLGCLSAQKCF